MIKFVCCSLKDSIHCVSSTCHFVGLVSWVGSAARRTSTSALSSSTSSPSSAKGRGTLVTADISLWRWCPFLVIPGLYRHVLHEQHSGPRYVFSSASFFLGCMFPAEIAILLPKLLFSFNLFQDPIVGFDGYKPESAPPTPFMSSY